MMADHALPTAPRPGPATGPAGPPTRLPGGRLLLLAAFVPVAFGCGNLTAGGAAEVEVVVAADDGASGSSASAFAAATAAAPATDPVEDEVAGLEGTLLVTFSLALLDGGEEVALTDGLVTLELPLQEGLRSEVGTVEVPAVRYSGYRVTFTRVEAEISSSPGQSPFPDFVEVDLSEGPLVFDRPGPLDLSTDERVRVVLNLRSGGWLSAADPSEGRVLRGVFRNAVRLAVESP